MSKWRKALRSSRTGVGLQMALALFLPAKSRGAANNQQPAKAHPGGDEDGHASPTAPPHLTGRWDFSRLFTVAAEPEVVSAATESAERIQHLAQSALKMTANAAEHASAAAASGLGKTNPSEQTAAAAAKPSEAAASASSFKPKPMTYEQIRLWLQSFNAGPYACLKYEGDVPYKETRDYVPRVMKHYEEDLHTDYDAEIEASAAKYGLDPQMIKAIMKTESDFRNDCVSHAGARGLLQIMPVVWKDIKAKYDFSWDYSSDVFDPQKNIEVGCAYLAWLRYDFLPRNFAAYEKDPAAPVALVRDRDLGVPDREGPRVVAKSDTHTPRPDTSEIASADVDVKAAEEVSAPKSRKADDEKPATRKSAVEITDSRSTGKASQTASAGKGKTRVTVKGTGKAVAISVGKSGKVTTREKTTTPDPDKATLSRREAIAKASDKEVDRDSQGG